MKKKHNHVYMEINAKQVSLLNLPDALVSVCWIVLWFSVLHGWCLWLVVCVVQAFNVGKSSRAG